MGNSPSSERELFEQVISSLLKSRGIPVAKLQIHRFVDFVHQVCPWFPEQGTVNVETWKTVGEKIKDYYCAWGPEKVPVDVFPIWTLIKDCLKGDSESSKWEKRTRESFIRKTKSSENVASSLCPPTPAFCSASSL